MAMSREYTDPDRPKIVSDDIIKQLMERFKGFPVPHEDFDPSTAPAGLLRKYGLPPKPDAERQPLLRRVWDVGFGRRMDLEAFTFDEELVDLLQKTEYRILARHVDEMPLAETRFETSGNWSGAYITANRDKRFLQIWGTWKIPASLALPPAPLQGPAGIPYLCSNWIGLDGQRLYVDSSLPQIGTVSTLEADGSSTAGAWIQWWARWSKDDKPPLPINLAVQPGDEMLCVLTAWDARTVIGVVVNLTANPRPKAKVVWGIAPAVKLPDWRMVTPEIAGATAEWIVERPRQIGQTARNNFPNYHESCFGHCVAVEGDDVDIWSWFGGLTRELQAPRLIRMFDRLHNPERTVFISMPHKQNDLSVRLTYGGF
jgi:hypothetical protein